MDIAGFDYEPTRIIVRVDDNIGPCDMIRFRDGRHFIVLDWVRTHDGDVPKEVIQIDPSRLDDVAFPGLPECRFCLSGQLSRADVQPLPEDLGQ